MQTYLEKDQILQREAGENLVQRVFDLLIWNFSLLPTLIFWHRMSVISVSFRAVAIYWKYSSLKLSTDTFTQSPFECTWKSFIENVYSYRYSENENAQLIKKICSKIYSLFHDMHTSVESWSTNLLLCLWLFPMFSFEPWSILSSCIKFLIPQKFIIIWIFLFSIRLFVDAEHSLYTNCYP